MQGASPTFITLASSSATDSHLDVKLTNTATIRAQDMANEGAGDLPSGGITSGYPSAVAPITHTQDGVVVAMNANLEKEAAEAAAKRKKRDAGPAAAKEAEADLVATNKLAEQKEAAEREAYEKKAVAKETIENVAAAAKRAADKAAVADDEHRKKDDEIEDEKVSRDEAAKSDEASPLVRLFLSRFLYS